MNTSNTTTLNGLFKEMYGDALAGLMSSNGFALKPKPYQVTPSVRKMLLEYPKHVVLHEKQFYVRASGGWVVGMPSVRWSSIKHSPGAVVCTSLHAKMFL